MEQTKIERTATVKKPAPELQSLAPVFDRFLIDSFGNREAARNFFLSLAASLAGTETHESASTSCADGFCQRVQAIIHAFHGGNMKVFAKAIGCPQSSIHRNLFFKRTDLLLKHADTILRAHPAISETWLYTGKGEMLNPEGISK